MKRELTKNYWKKSIESNESEIELLKKSLVHMEFCMSMVKFVFFVGSLPSASGKPGLLAV